MGHNMDMDIQLFGNVCEDDHRLFLPLVLVSIQSINVQRHKIIEHHNVKVYFFLQGPHTFHYLLEVATVFVVENAHVLVYPRVYHVAYPVWGLIEANHASRGVKLLPCCLQI